MTRKGLFSAEYKYEPNVFPCAELTLLPSLSIALVVCCMRADELRECWVRQASGNLLPPGEKRRRTGTRVKAMSACNCCNDIILHRLHDYIIRKGVGGYRSDSYRSRNQFAQKLTRSLSIDDGEMRRNIKELRKLYIYKRASERNLLAVYVYPPNHFENWLFPTFLCTTKNLSTIDDYTESLINFLEYDISCTELFAIENAKSLTLVPSPVLSPTSLSSPRSVDQVLKSCDNAMSCCNGRLSKDDRYQLLKVRNRILNFNNLVNFISLI